jgi:hypothetical protein
MEARAIWVKPILPRYDQAREWSQMTTPRLAIRAVLSKIKKVLRAVGDAQPTANPAAVLAHAITLL